MLVSFETLKEKLKTKGYKLTPQRKAILDVVMANQGKHLSTEEIYDIVRKDCPDIGLATVYRTLLLLSDLDVLSKINIDDGCVRYELNIHEDDHQHHHLICSNCGAILEVVDDLLEDLETRIEAEFDFQIKDHKLKFYGICSKCKKTL